MSWESFITIKLSWSLESSCIQWKLHMHVKWRPCREFLVHSTQHELPLSWEASLDSLSGQPQVSELPWEGALLGKKITVPLTRFEWVPGHFCCHTFTGSAEMTTRTSCFILVTLDTCRVHICHFIVSLFPLGFNPKKWIAVFYLISRRFKLMWLGWNLHPIYLFLESNLSMFSELLIRIRLKH